MTTLPERLKRFSRDTAGSFSMLAAVVLPTLAFGTGAAVDVSRFYNIKAQAQNAADATALAIVREAAVAGMTNQKLDAAADAFARNMLGGLAGTSVVKPQAEVANSTLTVDITVSANAFFGRILGITSQNIAVSATARMMGANTKICLLALEPTKNKTLEAAKAARITAPDCGFFINSIDPKGLDVKDSAKLTARQICTSGGFSGESYNFYPMPRRDCPAIPDPLMSRPPPPTGAHCDYSKMTIDTGNIVLKPGIYCGGLWVKGDAKVRLDPGIYTFRGSKLRVDGAASFEGKDVALYFQDSNAQFEFDKDSTISLEAPPNGPLAGILIYEDRSVSPGNKHKILSNNAHTLLGTIYLPQGLLFIDSNSPISQKAAFTIIVARQIEMISGPELFLNANYGSTIVPVPAGVGPVSGVASLVK